VVDSDNRCMARVWGGGKGTQCSYRRKTGCGDYCNRCHMKSEVTEKPLQFTAEGKHLGLFWGRFDEEKPWFSEGFVTVHQWKDPASAEKVAKAFANGATFHPHSGEAKTKVKGPRKPRGAKKSKDGKPKARRTKNAFFHFLGDARADKKAELIAAAAEGEKVGVSDVTKALGAVWKTMDADARAPFIKLEAAEKVVAQVELEASLATINDDTAESKSTVNDISGLGNDEVGDILSEGFGGDNELDDMIAELNNEEAVSFVIDDVSDEQDGESVEEHEVADGTMYYLGSCGTLYDMETHNTVGTLNEETNSLVYMICDVESVAKSEDVSDEQDGDDDDGESVEEHEVADGTMYYLGSDGTLYDVETQDIVGTLDEETNSLVPH